jgi:putative phosphoesterase
MGQGLPRTEVVEIEDVSIYVLHDVYALDLDPAIADFKAVISGHTHRPSIEKTDGVLYLNPGSARSPRSNYPATVAIIKVKGRSLTHSIIKL